MSVPTHLCAGATDTISFGFESVRNVVAGYGMATLGHTERVFLPDGVICNGRCSYLSPVTFTDFNPNDTLSSAEDIYYVRINLEHSYIGDIYMGITCPNGQRASLMNWEASGSSPCTDSVPNSHRGWSNAYSNTSGGTYLGRPYDQTGEPICDSTVPANAPGIGWNYCWSDNTTMGYQFAPDDGLIYRRANAINSGGVQTIDSSNVAAGTNFYHPNHSFSNLIGCPLNGTWTIEVIDAFSQDNGYIFEWDLALDATLIPSDSVECTVVSYILEGYGVETVNDSIFTVHSPDNLLHDTTCLYRLALVSSCGDTIDTTAAITFFAPTVIHDTAMACDSYYLDGHTYTRDTVITRNLHSVLGCDSSVVEHIIIHQSHTIHLTENTIENELPHTYHEHTFYGPVEDTLFHDTTAFGCDSTTVYTLIVDYNRYDTVDTAICANHTPFLWNGLSVSTTSTQQVTLTASNGADSIITLYLTVLPVPKAEIAASPLLVPFNDPVVHLYDQSQQGDGRLWLFGGNSSTERNIVYTFPSDVDSLPFILIIYGDNGCIDTAKVTIVVDRSFLFVPNVFTPNLAENNRWFPVMLDIESMEVWIYDRQGRLVTHLEGIDAYWDGTSDGTPCPQGSYVYNIKYRSTLRPDMPQTQTGTILLLR